MKKKAAPKKTRKTKKSTQTKPFSQPALKLIDQAAGLLRKAVLASEEKTVEGRRAFKRNALDFVDVANRKLHAAVREGTTLANNGLKKL
jgi:hypothetical protein